MEKEKAQQIKSLRALLEKGIWIIDNGKEIPEFKSISSIDWKDNNLMGYFEKMQQIVSCKRQYIEQFISLLEQGIEFNNETKAIILIAQALNKAIEQEEQYLKYQDIELLPVLKYIYWNAGFPLQAIKLCNLMLKKCIRDKYYECVEDYFDSIFQRNISLNSKRLALMNYKKQIINKCSEISPFSITINIDSNDFNCRKCDIEFYHEKRK